MVGLIVSIIALSVLALRVDQSPSREVGLDELTQTTLPTALAKPNDLCKLKVVSFEGRITSVDGKSTTVESESFSGSLIALGEWLLFTESEVSVYDWSKAREYVREGEAFIIMTTITKANKTLNVLLGLKQDGVGLIRPIMLRYYALKHLHSKMYIGVRVKLVYKGDNFIILEKEKEELGRIRGLALVNGKWIKAGYGEVTWSDVKDEFKIGGHYKVLLSQCADNEARVCRKIWDKRDNLGI